MAKRLAVCLVALPEEPGDDEAYEADDAEAGAARADLLEHGALLPDRGTPLHLTHAEPGRNPQELRISGTTLPR